MADPAFFASLKTELVYRVALPTREQARHRVVRWLERYNRVRRHSHCGYKAPWSTRRSRPTRRRRFGGQHETPRRAAPGG